MSGETRLTTVTSRGVLAFDGEVVAIRSSPAEEGSPA
jgi:hypothetical protein